MLLRKLEEEGEYKGYEDEHDQDDVARTKGKGVTGEPVEPGLCGSDSRLQVQLG